MQAIVIDEPGRWRLADLPPPPVLPGHVLVRVEACGLCGTDLHTLAGETPTARYPLVPGHESAGRVAELGAGVEGLVVGQRVGVFPSVVCGQCRYCWDGLPNLCDRRGGYGTAHPGGFAELLAVPVASCVVVPDRIPARDVAMVEPMACALHGLDRLGPAVHGRTLLLGAGTIGLIVLRLLRLAGAGEITVVDRQPARLERAAASGARVLGVEELQHEPDFDVAIDATGAPGAIEAGLDRLGKNGRFLLLGVAAPEQRVAVRPFDIYSREITILGSMAMQHTYRRAAELLVRGAIHLGDLVTHEFPLDQFAEALDTLRAGHGLKVVVAPSTADRRREEHA